MNVLRFKKGCKNWDTTYEAELDYEYTAEQEKRITSLILFRPDTGKKAVIPWSVFEMCSQGQSGYTDETGLCVKSTCNGLFVSCGYAFNILIHTDQVAAIKRAAKNLAGNLSFSVENILREYSMQRN